MSGHQGDDGFLHHFHDILSNLQAPGMQSSHGTAYPEQEGFQGRSQLPESTHDQPLAFQDDFLQQQGQPDQRARSSNGLGQTELPQLVSESNIRARQWDDSFTPAWPGSLLPIPDQDLPATELRLFPDSNTSFLFPGQDTHEQGLAHHEGMQFAAGHLLLPNLQDDVLPDRLSLSEDLDAQPSMLPDACFAEYLELDQQGQQIPAPATPLGEPRPHQRSSSPVPPDSPPARLLSRRRGRPQKYDTRIIPEDVCEDMQEGQAQESTRKKRGAKPKYQYKTEAEAVANRRERNRKTAIESYYKRKNRDNDLIEEIKCLKREKTALLKLEGMLGSTSVNRGVLKQLLEQTGSGEQTLHVLQFGSLPIAG